MKLHKKKMDVKAVIGIGTLIVFIAMVLVAAIASAVIIWTAENLEEDAERTGAGAREDVTGGIHIKTIEGQVTAGAVDAVYMYIALYGGAQDLDMNEVVIHIIASPKGGTPASEDVTYNAVAPGTAVAGTNYGATAVVDPLGAFPDTLDQQSILKIEILFGGLSSLPTLPPDSDLEIKIMQAIGGPTATEELSTPAGYPTTGGIIDLDN
jgi:flagellin FlaB